MVEDVSSERVVVPPPPAPPPAGDASGGRSAAPGRDGAPPDRRRGQPSRGLRVVAVVAVVVGLVLAVFGVGRWVGASDTRDEADAARAEAAELSEETAEARAVLDEADATAANAEELSAELDESILGVVSAAGESTARWNDVDACLGGAASPDQALACMDGPVVAFRAALDAELQARDDLQRTLERIEEELGG
jgi:hypothetical protein